MKLMAGGLMAALDKATTDKALSKSTSKAYSDEEGTGDSAVTLFDEYADDAFSALKSGDKRGFADALKKAVKECYANEQMDSGMMPEE